MITTIALAEDNSHYVEGASVTVTGWGISGDEGEYEDLPLADKLQRLVYEVANKEQCDQYWADDYEKHEGAFGAVDYDLEIPGIKIVKNSYILYTQLLYLISHKYIKLQNNYPSNLCTSSSASFVQQITIILFARSISQCSQHIYFHREHDVRD